MTDGLRTWAVQDSPPGAAITALVARGDVEVGWLDRALYEERSVVALYNARSATAIVPADEAAAYATAQLPADPSQLNPLARDAAPDAASIELAVEAIGDALDGRELSRDDLHEALRRRLPEALLPWCEGCQSHHARRGLLIMAGLEGRLCIAGRAGRQPVFARTDQLIAWNPPPREQAGAELVKRYRALYGTSNLADFAAWSGLGRAHAKALWSASDAPGGGEDLSGVRLLGPGDPQLQRRDRETLVPDRAWHKQVWKAIGGAGVVTQDGVAVALWRGRKRGKRLEITLEGGDVDVRGPAERLAPHRGCTAVTISG